jgi:hypothetical protein
LLLRREIQDARRHLVMEPVLLKLDGNRGDARLELRLGKFLPELFPDLLPGEVASRVGD